MFLQHDLTPSFAAVIITTLDVDHQNGNIKFGAFSVMLSHTSTLETVEVTWQVNITMDCNQLLA